MIGGSSHQSSQLETLLKQVGYDAVRLTDRIRSPMEIQRGRFFLGRFFVGGSATLPIRSASFGKASRTFLPQDLLFLVSEWTQYDVRKLNTWAEQLDTAPVGHTLKAMHAT